MRWLGALASSSIARCRSWSLHSHSNHMHIDLPDGVPRTLVRMFESSNDLSAWNRGSIRLRALDFYRRLDDATRRDTGEGKARHIVLGVNNTPVNYSGSLHNPRYVVSFCESDAPSVTRRRYGSFAAELDDPRTFVNRLAQAATRLDIETREVLSVALLRVRYNRDTVIDPEPERDERWRLLTCQKQASDADDREWRIVVTLSGPMTGAPEAIRVMVGGTESQGSVAV